MSKDIQAYRDMLDLPRPVSRRHKPMARENRAAQFSPFAALTGYEELIEEGSRWTEQQVVLGEEAIEELNRALQKLPHKIARKEPVELVYFEKDPFKAGGAYQRYNGRVLKMDEVEEWIMLEGGSKIHFEDIVEMQ